MFNPIYLFIYELTCMWVNDLTLRVVLQVRRRNARVVGRDEAEVHVHRPGLPAVVLHLQGHVNVPGLVTFTLEGELHVLSAVDDLPRHGAETQPGGRFQDVSFLLTT